MRLTTVVLCLVLSALCGLAMAQTTDVPTDHWAYDAVRELADRGYVLGYPDGKFLGDRTLTRYEFATLVMRIVDNMESRIDAVEARPLPGTAPVPTPTPAPTPAPIPAPAPSPAVSDVTQEDVQQIARLVEEFKVELVVIGGRLDRLETMVEDLEEQQSVTDSEVSRLKRVAVSGYIQNRYEIFRDDVNQDGSSAIDGFNIRRARARISATPTKRTWGTVYFGAEGNSASVKEAVIRYRLGDDPTSPSFSIGQMNWPFGYEVSYSSSRRETPERALWSRRLFPGERDRGAKLVFPFASGWTAELGLFDGTGIGRVNTDTTVVTDSTTDPPTTTTLRTSSNVARDYDENKDVVANLRYRSGSNLEFGVSGYFGKGVWNSARTGIVADRDKIRYGIDARYFLDRFTLKGEYIRAKGVDQERRNIGEWLDGYYGQLNYDLTGRDTLVARYETMSDDPTTSKDFGRRSAWHYGWVHQLDDRTKMKIFYEDNQEEKNLIENNILRLEWLTSF